MVFDGEIASLIGKFFSTYCKFLIACFSEIQEIDVITQMINLEEKGDMSEEEAFKWYYENTKEYGSASNLKALEQDLWTHYDQLTDCHVNKEMMKQISIKKKNIEPSTIEEHPSTKERMDDDIASSEYFAEEFNQMVRNHEV